MQFPSLSARADIPLPAALKLTRPFFAASGGFTLSNRFALSVRFYMRRYRVQPPRAIRRRDRNFLVLAILLGLVFCAFIGFILWVLNKQGRI
jgi:hypothetical protein